MTFIPTTTPLSDDDQARVDREVAHIIDDISHQGMGVSDFARSTTENIQHALAAQGRVFTENTTTQCTHVFARVVELIVTTNESTTILELLTAVSTFHRFLKSKKKRENFAGEHTHHILMPGILTMAHAGKIDVEGFSHILEICPHLFGADRTHKMLPSILGAMLAGNKTRGMTIGTFVILIEKISATVGSDPSLRQIYDIFSASIRIAAGQKHFTPEDISQLTDVSLKMFDAPYWTQRSTKKPTKWTRPAGPNRTMNLLSIVMAGIRESRRTTLTELPEIMRYLIQTIGAVRTYHVVEPLLMLSSWPQELSMASVSGIRYPNNSLRSPISGSPAFLEMKSAIDKDLHARLHALSGRQTHGADQAAVDVHGPSGFYTPHIPHSDPALYALYGYFAKRWTDRLDAIIKSLSQKNIPYPLSPITSENALAVVKEICVSIIPWVFFNHHELATLKRNAVSRFNQALSQIGSQVRYEDILSTDWGPLFKSARTLSVTFYPLGSEDPKQNDESCARIDEAGFRIMMHFFWEITQALPRKVDMPVEKTKMSDIEKRSFARQRQEHNIYMERTNRIDEVDSILHVATLKLWSWVGTRPLRAGDFQIFRAIGICGLAKFDEARTSVFAFLRDASLSQHESRIKNALDVLSRIAEGPAWESNLAQEALIPHIFILALEKALYGNMKENDPPEIAPLTPIPGKPSDAYMFERIIDVLGGCYYDRYALEGMTTETSLLKGNANMYAMPLVAYEIQQRILSLPERILRVLCDSKSCSLTHNTGSYHMCRSLLIHLSREFLLFRSMLRRNKSIGFLACYNNVYERLCDVWTEGYTLLENEPLTEADREYLSELVNAPEYPDGAVLGKWADTRAIEIVERRLPAKK